MNLQEKIKNRKHKSVKRQGVSSDNFNPAGN